MGADLEQTVLAVVALTRRQRRAAAVYCADRIAAEHPSPLDELMPKLAGRQLAQDPAIAAGVLELLDVLGLVTTRQKPEGVES